MAAGSLAAGSLTELSRQNNRVWPLSISLTLFLKELSRNILVTCVFRRNPNIEVIVTSITDHSVAPPDTIAYS